MRVILLGVWRIMGISGCIHDYFENGHDYMEAYG